MLRSSRSGVSVLVLGFLGTVALVACTGDDDFTADDDLGNADAAVPANDAGVEQPDGSPNGSDAGDAGTGNDAGDVDYGVATVEVYVDAFCPFSCTEAEVGATVVLATRVLDAEGAEIPGVPVVWQSADPALATVDATGLATGTGAGSVEVRAIAGGVTGTIQLSILPSPITRVEVLPSNRNLGAIGDTTTFTARAYNRLDQLVPDATFEWFVNNPNLGSVDASGTFTALAQGTGIVQAASGFAAGWAQVTVIGPIATRTAATFDQVSGGAHHACGVRAGTAYCWGYNYFGQLGNGEAGSVEGIGQATPVLGGLTFTSVAAGESHSCGITPGGAAYCWGAGGGGELGNGDPAERGSMVPIPVVGGHSFAQLAAGGFQTCGIDTAGALFCWGWDGGGAVGTGVDTNYWEPQAITPGTKYLDVVTGLDSTCGLQEDHVVRCWGTNTSGALGLGGENFVVPLPTPVVGAHRFSSIDSYGTHTCGIELDGSICCWGRNDTGQAGNGTWVDNEVPVKLESTESFVQVTTGAHHTCARTAAGQTLCTGDGQYGQLGTGLLDFSSRVVSVVGGLPFVDIEAGSHFTCGRLASGATYCWGDSSTGQLGGGFAGAVYLEAAPAPMVPPALD